MIQGFESKIKQIISVAYSLIAFDFTNLVAKTNLPVLRHNYSMN